MPVALPYFSCLRPDYLPSAIPLLVGIRVPVTPECHLLPSDYDFKLRLVSNHSPLAVESYFNSPRLPHQVIKLAGSDASEILLF